MLSASDITIVKSTIPLIEAAGSQVTDRFYQRLFEHYPELRAMFDHQRQQNGQQSIALFEAIVGYAKHIDELDKLQSIIANINKRHVTAHVQAEHYQMVGEQLLATMRELFAEQFSLDVERAWRNAYLQLAELFIGNEQCLYQRAKSG
ncbi:globin domain-containing protein [Thalassotalea maritima]|uniref:globin domain-containing protein n=1 Tax=Thalassotalea maritima TaxID=3242416 RepID=UPI0035273AF1